MKYEEYLYIINSPLQVATTRIPQRDCDVLQHFSFSESHHVVVNCKGIYYVVVPYLNDRYV